MSETKHTPGPWRVGPVDDTRVEDALGNEVAQINGDYNQPETWEVMEANARLIAAAPELLAALDELTNCVEDGCFCSEMSMASAVDTARAALAKARGQQ